MARALLALLLIFPAAPGAAAPGTEPGSAAALGREVQAYYERTKDFEARFVQTYTYASFGRSQTSRGTLRVKKPGKLRWDYLEPTPKTIVVNGPRLVQYEPDANQAFVDEHFDATALSAAVTFLLGKGSLEKEFTLSSAAPGRLVLTPRLDDGRVREVVLTVSEGGQVTATRVVDGSGNVNELAFEGLKRNVGLKDDLFALELPKDVHRVKAPTP
ncbi:MAG TPA: outer membrane lipoprotein carrier protein LolA [Anaeromyxobacteraceae bacterium]